MYEKLRDSCIFCLFIDGFICKVECAEQFATKDNGSRDAGI